MIQRVTPPPLFRTRVALALTLLIAALASYGSQGCLGPSLAAIEAAKLTPAEEARAKLFVAEENWVNAKIILADTITDLGIAGISIPASARVRILAVRDAGNLALSASRLALATGDIAEGGRFYKALAKLIGWTSSLLAQSRGL